MLSRDALFPIIPHRAEAVWSSPAALDGHSGMKSIAVLHLERELATRANLTDSYTQHTVKDELSQGARWGVNRLFGKAGLQ